ncbi:Hypothetical_protein [Hexamita inflata]|uniref:Hypothetical_protein n=1 Tax=Hexamita inflata TaxID=28002 RepID=A0AA86Q9Y9_9EUKA|nr:Hypothetical protein HINF_LOCUS36622 [Hexamita inflata]
MYQNIQYQRTALHYRYLVSGPEMSSTVLVLFFSRKDVILFIIFTRLTGYYDYLMDALLTELRSNLITARACVLSVIQDARADTSSFQRRCILLVVVVSKTWKIFGQQYNYKSAFRSQITYLSRRTAYIELDRVAWLLQYCVSFEQLFRQFLTYSDLRHNDGSQYPASFTELTMYQQRKQISLNNMFNHCCL